MTTQSPVPDQLPAARTVSRNVRRLRRARDWTQAETAERFNTFSTESPWSVATWSASEQSDRKRQRAWTADQVTAAAQTFGVTVGDLFAECCSQCCGEPPEGFTCNTCGGAR